MSDGEFGAPGQPGMTPEQIAYMRGQQDATRRLTTPRMTVFRVICGIVWGVLAVGFTAGAVYNLIYPNIVQAVFGVVFAGLSGWYDYRIWTLKARRLFLII